MKRPIEDYVALALIADLTDPADFTFGVKSDFGGRQSYVFDLAKERVGFDFSIEIFQAAVRTLAACGLVRISEADFAEAYVKVFPDKFGAFIENAASERVQMEKEGISDLDDAVKTDFPNAHALSKHDIFSDYSIHEDEWARDVIEGLRKQFLASGFDIEGFRSYLHTPEIPASNRVVTLGHNQISLIEDKSDALAKALEDGWDEPNEPDETSKAVGMYRAGMELVRAAVFEFELFRMSMIAGLNLLIEKYKDHAIGAAAGQLLDLLLIHVGLK